MTRKNTPVRTPVQTLAPTAIHTPRTSPAQDLNTIAMLNHTTIAQLRALKLNGFADALQQQHEQADGLALSFDERLALLVEREVHARNDRKHARLLQRAALKYPGASIEDASFESVRGIDRSALVGLALSTWIERGETVTLAGATEHAT
ncbi:MAG TPA: ATP-binding protein [Pseudorhodoferax sp.]|nr:ATP-binding protein [Pseudorhodoferax sp.]